MVVERPGSSGLRQSGFGSMYLMSCIIQDREYGRSESAKRWWDTVHLSTEYAMEI